MSYAWSFHSFSDEGFRHVFGHSTPDQIAGFVDLVTSDFGGLNPSPLVEELSRSILSSGISYEGLLHESSKLQDDLVRLAFSPEAFEEQLELEHLSPDGLHPSVISELVARLGNSARHLPFLLAGRRYGQDEPANCEYCLLRPDEVSAILREIRQAVAVERPWSAPYVPEVIEECLLDPLENAASKERPVFCHLS